MTIHRFKSTGAAYDACQCDENVRKGDILLIERERVVGIADTWPMAVTPNHGEFHLLGDSITDADVCAATGISPESFAAARALAAELFASGAAA